MVFKIAFNPNRSMILWSTWLSYDNWDSSNFLKEKIALLTIEFTMRHELSSTTITVLLAPDCLSCNNSSQNLFISTLSTSQRDIL